jgi:hypothetical protein
MAVPQAGQTTPCRPGCHVPCAPQAGQSKGVLAVAVSSIVTGDNVADGRGEL